MMNRHRPIGLPDRFEVGAIKILSVKAQGLHNNEWVGKSDPYFCVDFGPYKESSRTLNNAGNEVVWSDVGMIIEVDKKSLHEEKLSIAVFDENASRRDVPLGCGVISVTQLCGAVGIEKNIRVDLSDQKGAICGALTVKAVLVPGVVQVTYSQVLTDLISCCYNFFLRSTAPIQQHSTPHHITPLLHHATPLSSVRQLCVCCFTISKESVASSSTLSTFKATPSSFLLFPFLLFSFLLFSLLFFSFLC